MTVYENWSMRVAHEGSREDCREWIMNQAFTMSDGRKIFRHWEADGMYHYDVGCVYCTYQDIFDK